MAAVPPLKAWRSTSRPQCGRWFTFTGSNVKTPRVPHSVSDTWKQLSSRKQLVVIAGPCVIESEQLCFEVAAAMLKVCRKLGATYVFKASYDKANRTSAKSFRGPGIENGLGILANVRRRFGVPVLTDVHTEEQARL